MIERAAVMLAALALLSWAVGPLLARRRAPDSGSRSPAREQQTEDLLEAKQSIYRSIVDLELDRGMGKIDDGTYDQLRRRDKSEALQLIRQLDEASSEEEARSKLEDEIRAARNRLRKQ